MQSRSKNKANIMYFVLDSGLSITVEESGLGITDQWKHTLTVKYQSNKQMKFRND